MKISETSPSFGMAINSNKTAKILLKSRIKSDSEIKKLDTLIKKANNNSQFNIKLMTSPNGDKLVASIESSKDFLAPSQVFTESKFASKFLSPIRFINKIVKTADRKAANMPNTDITEKLEKILNQI